MGDRTQIFKTFEDFLNRKDKAVNGVSAAFAVAHPDYLKDNESNTGCWNCVNCSDCRSCAHCSDCRSCAHCAYCSGGAHLRSAQLLELEGRIRGALADMALDNEAGA